MFLLAPVPLDPVSNIFYSLKQKEMFQAAKKSLKVDSQAFRPTYLPRIWGMVELWTGLVVGAIDVTIFKSIFKNINEKVLK